EVLSSDDTFEYAIPKGYLAQGEEYEIINTHFTEFNGNRLQFLGKSIMEGLAVADIAIFIDDWEKYDGCRCEHFIASQYKIPCIYIYLGGGFEE
ncbi:MAG: hypothetical protein LBH43_14820, partial [Treponema sp.]|nr:hypothetical protein [Treponema sp.]